MNPYKRFSLRLSARLIYGAIKLYERQSYLLLHSVFALNMAITKRRGIEEEKPKRKHKKSTSEEQPVQAPQQIQNELQPLQEEQLMPVDDVIKMLNSSQQVQNTEITLRENTLVEAEKKIDNFGEEEDPMAIFQQDNLLLRASRAADSILEQPQEMSRNITVVAQIHCTDKDKSLHMKDISHFDLTAQPEEVADASKTMELPMIDESILSTVQQENVSEKNVASTICKPQAINDQEVRGDKRPHETINLDETPELDPNVSLPIPKKKRQMIKDTILVLNPEYMKARISYIHWDKRCEVPLLDAMNIEAAVSDLRFLLPHRAFEGRRLLYKIRRMSEVLRNAHARNLITRTVPNDKSGFGKRRAIERIRGNAAEETFRNITLNAPISHLEEQHTTLLPNENNISIMAPSPTLQSMQQDKSLMPEITYPEIEISKDIITAERSILGSQKQRNKPSSILMTTIDEIRQDLSRDKTVSFNISERRKKNISAKTDASKEIICEQPALEDIQVMNIDQNMPKDVQEFQIEVINRSSKEVDKTINESNEQRSSNNETMLGSLDRTQVSLGDESISAEEKYIKDYLEKEWDNMGVWEKIMSAKRSRCYPLNVEVLVQRATIPDDIPKRRVAVNAFKAILFMKKYRFAKVEKHPESLTILNIRSGDAFKEMMHKQTS